MHITLPSDSSRSDVLQTLEDGKRIAVRCGSPFSFVVFLIAFL